MWSSTTYEARSWEQDPDELRLIPKSRRSKVLPTYDAVVPASIAAIPVEAGCAHDAKRAWPEEARRVLACCIKTLSR